MSREFKNFINGEWLAGSETFTNINPSELNKPVGESYFANTGMVKDAISGAVEAGQKWALTGIEQRSDILMKIGEQLMQRKNELGELIAIEEGKTLKEGIGEIDRAARFFYYYAGEALRIIGDFTDSVRPNVGIEVSRSPLGCVLVVTPWNFPVALPAWKIAPALAYGNSVIFKPSEHTPASACELMKIMHEAGVPAGTVQLVLGEGKTIGMELLQSEQIDGVSFTGSVATGKKIAMESAKLMKKFQLEMGGKNALIVMDDCNLEEAVQSALGGAFFGTGQKCTASSRIIVAEGIYNQFLEKFVDAAKSVKVGHALSPDSVIGPCVNKEQFQKNESYMKLALDENAKIAYQSPSVKFPENGYYFGPVIFTDTHNKMRINREEMFGPMTCLIKAKNYEEALELCNDTEFGLTAGIMTSSLKHATHFKRNAQAGCVMVNLPTAGTDYHVPFGGTKSSSYGPREQGSYAAEFYTRVKTAYIKA